MTRLLLLDVLGDGDFHEIEINEDNGIDDYHKYLKCNVFDIVSRRVGDTKFFDMFVDDIGLFAENPQVAVFDEDLQPMLVGNVIFANHDSAGNTTGLTDEDIDLIKENSIVLLQDGKTRKATLASYC